MELNRRFDPRRDAAALDRLVLSAWTAKAAASRDVAKEEGVARLCIGAMKRAWPEGEMEVLRKHGLTTHVTHARVTARTEPEGPWADLDVALGREVEVPLHAVTVDFGAIAAGLPSRLVRVEQFSAASPMVGLDGGADDAVISQYLGQWARMRVSRAAEEGAAFEASTETETRETWLDVLGRMPVVLNHAQRIRGMHEAA